MRCKINLLVWDVKLVDEYKVYCLTFMKAYTMKAFYPGSSHNLQFIHYIVANCRQNCATIPTPTDLATIFDE